MRRLVSMIGLAAAAVLVAPAAAFAHGAVYVSTNATSGNAVQILHRAGDGSLHAGGLVATGGKGTGAGLGSEGAVTLSTDGHWLFVVNAGSDSLTWLRVTAGGGLVRAGSVWTHGTTPVSVTQSGGLVYVVNSGSASIAGFRIGSGGLHFLTGSVRQLSDPGATPAEIAFRPGGGVLAVTEKATSTVDTFHVRSNGRPSAGIFTASSGSTPFGFAFAGPTLIVSEAVASAATSYHVGPAGGLHTISASVLDGQASACWVATTRDGRYAFVSNTAAGTISSYGVGTGGGLRLARSAAAGMGSGSAPGDSAFDASDAHLYVLDGAGHRVVGFARSGAALAPVGASVTLPASAAGLAAR